MKEMIPVVKLRRLPQFLMVRPNVRRRCDPHVVQRIWNAIVYIRQQKQISNHERITRYLGREYDMHTSQVQCHLENAVSDQLVNQYKAVGFKGSRVGVEQDGFRLPDVSEIEKDSHDWYCFVCHKPGEVLTCNECWRVYHTGCTEQDWTGPEFICTVCKDFEAMRRKQRIKRKELNRLLSYTVNRLKEKFPFKTLHPRGTKAQGTKELHKLFVKEEEKRYEAFIYMSMDLNTMEAKTKARRYKYLEQFHADAQIILHNVLICYGETGTMAELANIMIRDCKYDLDEIRQCKDCYQYSNAKPKDWFAMPCRPPHELVYAKQKGFSYWPAKVIKITKDGYDVRFFGGWHQRAVIQKTSVKPVDTNIKSMAIKRTAGFVRACEELKRHQQLIEKYAAETEEEEEEEQEEQEAEEAEEEAEDEPAPEEEEEEEEEEQELAPPPPKKIKKIKEEQVEKKKTKLERGSKKIKIDREGKKMKMERESKKMRDEQDSSREVISSSNVVPEKPAPTPEDANVVTSSEDNIHSPRVVSTTDIGTQTSRKLTHPGKQPHKSTQTDLEVAASKCDCDTKYNKIFNDFKQRLEHSHKEDKEKALKELSDRLQADFEEDKQQAVSRAIANVQREVERIRRQTEERCKEQYMEEMKKLAQKHNAEISATKKKQWCYNCEEEAMYHCCWNTSYCSVKCQQEHWHHEHKRTCRRKR